MRSPSALRLRGVGRATAAIGTLLACLALAASIVASPAHAFGSGGVLRGADHEHEKITRVALGCNENNRPPTRAPDCFQPRTLDSLAGKRLYIGAVEMADFKRMHRGQSPDYWHCYNADWLVRERYSDEEGSEFDEYPHSRTAAAVKLKDCVSWARAMVDQFGYYTAGLGKLPPNTPSAGVLDVAGKLILGRATDRDLYGDTSDYWRVDTSNPGVGLFSPLCRYTGEQGKRPKCDVLESFGYLLHTAQDFYAHTNWGDETQSSGATVEKPYGVARGIGQFLRRGITPLFDLTRNPLRSTAFEDLPRDFTGGCVPSSTENCDGRVLIFDQRRRPGISKDYGSIDGVTGAVQRPRTERGRVINRENFSNFQFAVGLAYEETMRQWRDLRSRIYDRAPDGSGSQIICALVLDVANNCNSRPNVFVIKADGSAEDLRETARKEADRRAGAATANASAAPADPAAPAAPAPLDGAIGERLLGGLDATDRVAVVTVDDAGNQDVDPFVRPAHAHVDDPAAGDPAPDPVVPAALSSGGERLSAEAAGLRSARTLLAASTVTPELRGTTLVTDTLGDVGQLVEQIRSLGRDGTTVSLAFSGGYRIPVAVLRAIDAANGTAFAGRDRAALVRYVQRAGRSRLDDPLPSLAAYVRFGAPPIQAVTGDDRALHRLSRSNRPAAVRVTALDDPLTVTVTERDSRRTRRIRVVPGAPASATLRAGGRYDVAVAAPSGSRYTIGVSARGAR